MAYTSIDDPTLYFNTLLYTGNGTSSHAVTGVGFTQDFTWIKERSQTESHFLFDKVRGDNKYFNSNNTDIQYTESGGMAFNSNGFTLGAWNSVNENTENYVSWNWKESATSGFDIVSYTGNGSNPRTISHNLSAVPKFIITKRLSGDTASIHCYHASLGNGYDIYLNGANAKASDTSWNSTSPTSSVFTVNGANVNVSSTPYIAYLFSEKQAFSKFSSYIGNGNTDGTYVHLGFKPAFVMIKNVDSTENWIMYDNKRDPINVMDTILRANTNAADNTASAHNIDFLSNGFKHRNSDNQTNKSGENFIYMAFAESPFVTSTGIPTTAR